jgi:plasmid stabilization system protein ParE
MISRKSDDFIADVERQFEWYAVNANWKIAERYLAAIESTCQLLVQHPQFGPRVGFSHPRLCDWRFIVVFRPFQKHILFYEIKDDEVLLRRAMHGHRNLPRRLIEPPEVG